MYRFWVMKGLHICQIGPPFWNEEMAGDFREPRADLFGLLVSGSQEFFQLCGVNVAHLLYLVRLRVHIHLSLDDEDVIYLVFTPYAFVRGSLVVDPREVCEFFNGHLNRKTYRMNCYTQKVQMDGLPELTNELPN